MIKRHLREYGRTRGIAEPNIWAPRLTMPLPSTLAIDRILHADRMRVNTAAMWPRRGRGGRVTGLTERLDRYLLAAAEDSCREATP